MQRAISPSNNDSLALTCSPPTKYSPTALLIRSNFSFALKIGAFVQQHQKLRPKLRQPYLGNTFPHKPNPFPHRRISVSRVKECEDKCYTSSLVSSASTIAASPVPQCPSGSDPIQKLQINFRCATTCTT